MTTKYPRDRDEPICEWCQGTGEYEFKRPDGTTDQQPCGRCNGTGWARFDPTSVLARTKEQA